MADPVPGRLVIDSWYGPPLVERLPGAITVDDLVRRRLGRLTPLATRSGILRAVAIRAVTRRVDTVVTTSSAPGARTLIATGALLGRRTLVLLEYVSHPPAGPGISGALRRAAFLVLRRVLLPPTLLAAQVLTIDEVAACATTHHIDAERFRFVPWPARVDAQQPLTARTEGGRRVFSSGRRADWATFAAAATGADWDITAVCGADDEALVRALLEPLGARVLAEVSQDDHLDLVREATVYVVAVPETGASIGQIRVMNAADAGTPLVVSRVSGVAGYVDPTCAVLVSPGDPRALTTAVDSLLADPTRQLALRTALHSRGAGRDMAVYLDELAELTGRLHQART